MGGYTPAWYANPGNLMVATGVLHQALCFCVPPLRERALRWLRGGFGGALARDPDMAFIEFFLISGNLMLGLGALMRAYITAARRPLPLGFGAGCMAAAVFHGLYDPESGCWALAAIGALICKHAAADRDDADKRSD